MWAVCVDVVPAEALVACLLDPGGHVCQSRACLHAAMGTARQPHGELDQGTGDCSSLVLSDQDGRNPF